MSGNEDKAGQEYWDRNWLEREQTCFVPDGPSIRHYSDTAHAQILETLLKGLPSEPRVMEAGCADSSILPYVMQEHGARIAGIDYSPLGCEKFRRRIAAMGLSADVECCDLFDPPAKLEKAFDAVISFGLIEHFSDTAQCVQALRRFLCVGGRMLSVVPNMHGMVGQIQKLVAPSVYRVHVPLSPADLAAIHEAAGLRVLQCDYLLPVGFGVVNYLEPGVSRAGSFFRKAVVSLLARLSWLAWFVERVGFKLPRTRAFSPYCYCIAERPD